MAPHKNWERQRNGGVHAAQGPQTRRYEEDKPQWGRKRVSKGRCSSQRKGEEGGGTESDRGEGAKEQKKIENRKKPNENDGSVRKKKIVLLTPKRGV